MRIHRMDNKPRPMSWLPNRNGYLFIGVKHDGTRVNCKVIKVLDAYVIDVAPASEFQGWFPMPMGVGHGV